jgi:ribosome-associated toxin RatA of RatAB toxin-antitoxin module
MGRVVCEQTSAAPVDTVCALAKQVEGFPEIMPDVESVEVLERDGCRITTRWVGLVRQLGRRIRWTEQDEWDDDRKVCTFSQVEGDYEVYRGVWTFSKTESGGTLIHLDLEVDINVPLIGALLKKVVTRLAKQNAEGMLAALARKAEAAS